MNNQPKKSSAQGTIEYLIIIAIIVVIALVVVSILTGFLDNGSQVSSKTQNISQKAQLISLGDAIVTPSGDYVLEIQSNEVGTISITKIITDDEYELFSSESLYLGTKKVFPIYTNEDCEEGTTITKNIVIQYTTQHQIQKTQQFDNVTIPCQNVNVNENKLINPLLNISFIEPTPQNNSVSNQNYFDVNVFSQGSKNISTFIDFNNSLVGWWRMDDYNGTHVLDYTGNNHGSFQGGLSDANIVGGKMGKALEFDGAQDYLESSLSDNHPQNSATISAWINPRDYTNDNIYRIANIKKDGNIYGHGFDFSLYTYGRFLCAFNGGEDRIFAYSSSVSEDILNSDELIHIAYTWSNLEQKWYLNGEDIGLGSNVFIENFEIGEYFNEKLRVGVRESGSSHFFNGSIDDVMIFNRALSAEEVAALYARTSEKYLDTNFSNLSNGYYFYTAYAQDTLGNVIQTQERKITIQN